ncbi:MAG: hypothetical protein ABI388_00535 [Bacteroidia bacterium]
MIKPIYIFILLAFCLVSCSLQKRLYTKGFYSHKNQTAKKPEAIAKADTLPSVAIIHSKTKKPTLVASLSKFILLKNVVNIGCDTIVLKNGVKITGTVTEIKKTKIEFKSCDSTRYSNSSIDKADVNFINFANGTKQQTDFKLTQEESNKTNPFAIAGFIASIFALFFLVLFVTCGSASIVLPVLLLFIALFLFFAGFVLSTLSLVQISNSSTDNKKGLVLAVMGIIISLAFIALLIFHFK